MLLTFGKYTEFESQPMFYSIRTLGFTIRARKPTRFHSIGKLYNPQISSGMKVIFWIFNKEVNLKNVELQVSFYLVCYKICKYKNLP
jgi:hypothetical protein